MKNILYTRLHAVSSVGIMSLCPDIVQSEESLFDAKFLVNNKDDADRPFILITSQLKDKVDKEQIKKVVRGFIDKIGLDVFEEELKYEDRYQGMIQSDLRIDKFRNFINSPWTSAERKELYRNITCNRFLLNVKGLLMFGRRKNGTVELELNDNVDPNKTYFYTPGLIHAESMFASPASTEAVVAANTRRYPGIESAVFEAWPDNLKPVTPEAFIGFTKSLALTDLVENG